MISALGEGIMTIADGPEMPSINDFLPDPFVFQGTPFAINRIILVRKEAKLPKKQFRQAVQSSSLAVGRAQSNG